MNLRTLYSAMVVTCGASSWPLGCTHPCDDLKQRAERCGGAPSRYADREDSVCRAVREELLPEVFDPFATCVANSPCDDTDTIDRCQEIHIESQVRGCMQLKLWSVACGLEPIGTRNDCESIDTGASFNSWVDCVTDDGCPVQNDPRYEACSEKMAPGQLTESAEACTILAEWTEACGGEAPQYLPGAQTNVLVCIVQAEPFDAQSFFDYAECVSQTECTDTLAQLNCVLGLGNADGSDMQDTCTELIDFARSCNSPVAGASVEACMQLFARFTAASFSAYAACIQAYPCEDPLAALRCANRLELDATDATR